MKRISLLFTGFSLLILMSLQAQEKGSFTIKMVDHKYIAEGSDMSKSYATIEIVFDQSMESFTIGVFSAKNVDPVFSNRKFSRKEEDIPFTGGLAKITFLNDHKIKECPEISKTVPDTFMVKINDAMVGPFFLKPKPGANLNPDRETGGNVGKNSPGYKTGVLFYDALYLNAHKNDRKYFDTIKLIFKNYNIYNADSLNRNPFLKPGFKGLYTGVEGGGKGLDIASLASGIGGLDVTNIAYGFADFLVKRTKEELNVAFFSKFTETLNKPGYADLRILFPNTCELLQAIGDQIYDYNRYLQNLREAFMADIITLDANLPGIIPNHKAFFGKNFGLTVSLNSACFVTSSLKNGMHPGDILDQYPLDLYFKREGDTDYFNKNWSGAFQTLQLISLSLREAVDSLDTYWVSYQKVKELVNSKDAFQIYLGLIYQGAKNERFKNIPYANNSFVKLLDGVNYNVDYPAYKGYITNFASKVSDLNQMIKNRSKPKNDSMAFENYARYFKASVDLLEYSTMATSLPHFKEIIKINLHDTLKNYFKIAYETSDLACDINRKNYSSAVNHAVTIYNLVRTKPLQTQLDALTKSEKDNLTEKALRQKARAEEKYNKAINKYVEAVYSNAMPDTVKFKVVSLPNTTNTPIGGKDEPINKSALNDSLNKSKDLLEKLTRYGAFISTVATAKNPDEVEKAIEAAALPSGSSRIKRETPFNVSLNAYCGLFVGYERIKGIDPPLTWNYQKVNSYGVTAPIGVSISTGGHSFAFAWPSHEGHWSYSVFISLIDIGAVASFRFQNNDSISQVPTIKLQDIVSPGLFFSIGFPKCPLSLNMGAQVGPNLRNVSQMENGTIVNKYQENVYWRYSVSLVVDIPIFNLYTKSKH